MGVRHTRQQLTAGQGTQRRSRTGPSLLAGVSTGVWCCVCTNQVEQQAPARISAVSRTTDAGAAEPPYSFGAFTPSRPERRISAR